MFDLFLMASSYVVLCWLTRHVRTIYHVIVCVHVQIAAEKIMYNFLLLKLLGCVIKLDRYTFRRKKLHCSLHIQLLCSMPWLTNMSYKRLYTVLRPLLAKPFSRGTIIVILKSTYGYLNPWMSVVWYSVSRHGKHYSSFSQHKQKKMH